MDHFTQNSLKIKKFNQDTDEVLSMSKDTDIIIDQIGQDKKFLPDNYFTYDIHRHLNTDFHTIKPSKKTNIFICPFRIIETKNDKITNKPFLEYLLFKYPDNTKKIKNVCIFPFQKYDNKTSIKNIGKKIINTIFNETYNPLGYIMNNNGIFLFYKIDFNRYSIKLITKKEDYIWATIHEICNLKKYITFPIHYSVYNLFYQNPKLIYLKNKKKKCIETPTIAYYGDSQELLPYIATMGIKSSAIRIFGPYYYFTDFKGAIRAASWSSNYKERIVFDTNITDKHGKYKQGGIVRFALFLDNYHVAVHKKNDSLYELFNIVDTNMILSKTKAKKMKKLRGAWTKKYDSLIVSNLKSFIFKISILRGTEYILKNFNSYYSLSLHLVDKTTLKTNWDYNYDLYDIK